MTNRRRLSLGALCGLAAAVTFIALAGSTPANATPGADDWFASIAEGNVTVEWQGHTHDDTWTERRTLTPEDWAGSPGPNPCDNPTHHGLPSTGVERQHCAYVVVHQSPWEVDGPDEHGYDGDDYLSLCLAIGGATDEGLIYNAPHVACSNKFDPFSNPNRHGDEDLILQYPYLRGKITPNTQPDEIIARGHHHSSHAPHGHVRDYGAHSIATGGHAESARPLFRGRPSHEHPTEHKTVMFWV